MTPWRGLLLLIFSFSWALLLRDQGSVKVLVLAQQQNQSCPLDFSVIAGDFAFARQDTNASHLCNAVREELNLVVAAQLSRSQAFLFDNLTALACLQGFEGALRQQGVTSDFKVECSIDSQSLQIGSSRCPNITTVSDFRKTVSSSSLANIQSSCNVPLNTGASCSSCIAAVVSSVTYKSPSNSSWSCLDYSDIFAAAVVNPDGPLDPSTVACLFYNQQSRSSSAGKPIWKFILIGVGIVVVLVISGGASAWILWRRSSKKQDLGRIVSRNRTLEESMHSNASLIKFDMEEMKGITRNFHRSLMIGQGGFGNVYKGVFPDGTEVALKRFKNCSPAGDEGFVHEVEMISSVRHKNLVPLLGWCIGSLRNEGHQRIIVYEFMRNGSLDDHLFGKLSRSSSCNLDWPARQKIILGTAKGLAYLHNGAQPAIIHRDIKCSNILLDGELNARVADFGLAKFAVEGMTHITTGVAGTQGYVAPEYILYQQLTDKSDVYSFGIVFLEILSGRKALVYDQPDGSILPIADWAWSVMKRGNNLEILDRRMEELGSADVMERFILVALLCAHPQVGYRPSMAQVVKMLENNDFALPQVPERPIPLMISAAELTSMSSCSGSVHFSSEGLPR